MLTARFSSLETGEERGKEGEEGKREGGGRDGGNEGGSKLCPYCVTIVRT